MEKEGDNGTSFVEMTVQDIVMSRISTATV